MNQSGLIRAGETVFLAQYQVNQYSMFRFDSSTQRVMRQIIDFNLRKAKDTLLVLKKSSSLKGIVFSKIHFCSLYINQILIKQKFYIALFKATLCFIGHLGLIALNYGSFIIGLTSLILVSFKLNFMAQINFFLIARILNLHKLIPMFFKLIQPQLDVIEGYCEDLFESAKDDLEEISLRVYIEAQISYNKYLVVEEKVSSYGLDEKAILNKKNNFGRLSDPIDKQYLKTNLNEARNFRLGRFLVDISSLIEYLLKADSGDLSSIQHPIFKNRMFSASEVESLKKDLGNFFSCELKILENIFKITLNDKEKALFSTNASDVLAFIKAIIFFHYIALKHPLFNPEHILKKDIFSEFSTRRQELILQIITLKEKSLFL